MKLYKVSKNKNTIKLFGLNFIKNNKDKCKYIYENKEYELKEYLYIYDNNNDEIEIKLIINNVTDMNAIFSNCSSL